MVRSMPRVVDLVLPELLNIRSIGQLHALVPKNPSSNPGTVKLDFTRLRFIEPTGVVGLCNLWRQLESFGWAIDCRASNVATPAIVYLDDAGFFIQLRGRAAFAERARRATVLPLGEIRSSDAHHFVTTEVRDWMSNALMRNVAVFAPFLTTTQEVFNNIGDHSAQQIGCIYGQHFPQRNEMVLAFGDID